MKNFYRKNKIYIFGTVASIFFIGPITTTLGTYVFQHIWSGFVWAVLVLSTLGLSQLQNTIYSNIAMGFHEDASVNAFLFLLAFLASGYFALGFRAVITRTDKESRFNPLRYKPIALSFCVLAFIFVTYFAVQISYENAAVTYFEQLLTIDKPVLSEQQVSTLQSQFAQIKNRNDYIYLTTQLENIAVLNHFHAPARIPFIL
jgi:succinate dehydrogenase hydrophobic anchor subunit